MAILGTGTSDPNFYARQAQATGQALASFADAIARRRAQKDQASQQEISSAFKLMAEYPELADGPYAQTLREKYAGSHPEVPGLLDVISKRNQLSQQIPAAGQKWEKGWGDLESTYQNDQQRLAEMPDTTSVNMPLDPLHMMFMQSSGVTSPPRPPLRSAASSAPEASLINSSPFFSAPAPGAPLRAARNVTLELPNPEKLSLSQKLQNTKPEMFPVTAMQKLSPQERLRASVYAKSMGYNAPDLSVIDELKMLPEHVRAQRMVELGMIPPGATADVVGYENKLRVPPATQAELDHQDETQRQGHQNRIEELTLSDRFQRERMQIADRLRAAQQGRTLANQKEVIDYRHAVVDGSDDDSEEDSYDWSSIVSDSKVAASDWDKRTTTATKGLTGKKREEANTAFISENGPRPMPVPAIVAKQIGAEIDGQGLTGSDADEAAIAASSMWQQARRGGASAQEATKKAISFVNPDNRVRIDFSSIKDDAKRNAAVADYAKRLQAGESQGQAFKEAWTAAQAAAAPQKAPPVPQPAPAGTTKQLSADDVRARVKTLYPKATPGQQEAIVLRTLAKLQGGG